MPKLTKLCQHPLWTGKWVSWVHSFSREGGSTDSRREDVSIPAAGSFKIVSCAFPFEVLWGKFARNDGILAKAGYTTKHMHAAFHQSDLRIKMFLSLHRNSWQNNHLAFGLCSELIPKESKLWVFSLWEGIVIIYFHSHLQGILN